MLNYYNCKVPDLTFQRYLEYIYIPLQLTRTSFLNKIISMSTYKISACNHVRTPYLYLYGFPSYVPNEIVMVLFLPTSITAIIPFLETCIASSIISKFNHFAFENGFYLYLYIII